ERPGCCFRPGCPRHPAPAPPAGKPAAVVRIVISDRSRLPRRECVGQVLRPRTTAAQGFPGPNFDVLGVPQDRPQDTPDRPQPTAGSPQETTWAVDEWSRP